MTWPRVQIVDRPDVDALVRFDFQTDLPLSSTRVLADGFTIGAPSLGGDLDAVGADYGPRSLSFDVRVQCPRVEAMRVLSALARCLLVQSPGWLLFQLDELSSPVWFELLRPRPGELDFKRVFWAEPDRDSWRVKLDLPAEAFAVGQEITFPAVTVLNNPALAGALAFEVPPVIGDAPAPARVVTSPRDAQSWMLSSAAVPAGVSWPLVSQLDSVSPGGSTGLDFTAGRWSGGSALILPSPGDGVTFETPPLPLGTYKVMARIGLDADPGLPLLGVSLTAGTQSAGFSKLPPARVKAQNAALETWVDLGDARLPLAVKAAGAQEISLSISWSVISGDTPTTRIFVDAVAFIPVDLVGVRGATLRAVQTNAAALAASAGVPYAWDGEDEVVSAIRAGYESRESLALTGGFPTLVPDAKNVIHVLTHVDDATAKKDRLDGPNATMDVTVSYRPRWLWLADRTV